MIFFSLNFFAFNIPRPASIYEHAWNISGWNANKMNYPAASSEKSGVLPGLDPESIIVGDDIPDRSPG